MVKFHPKPVIYGLQSLSLSDSERQFFATAHPFGFILFSRNIESAEQLRDLLQELADYSPFDTPVILIDQEGGRVARIRPPLMLEYPAAQKFHQLYMRQPQEALQGVYLAAKSMAAELRCFGITVNCAPVCDILTESTHDVIGNRAFGNHPQDVSLLAESQLRGLHDGGTLGVIKHIPGHGRASVDSHESLPTVAAKLSQLACHDFVPFRHLRTAVFAMTAHILFTDLDRKNPVTLSPKIIAEIIRKQIGFEGLLMSDDLCMGALHGGEEEGRFGELSLRVLQAGCDLLLHCSGDMAEMVAIDEVLPPANNKGLDFFTNRYKKVETGGLDDVNLCRERWLSFRTNYEDIFDG